MSKRTSTIRVPVQNSGVMTWVDNRVCVCVCVPDTKRIQKKDDVNENLIVFAMDAENVTRFRRLTRH